MRLTNEQFGILRSGSGPERQQVLEELMDKLLRKLKIADEIGTVRYLQGQINVLETMSRVLV